MAKRLRVGVIGAGYFSQFHVEAWTALAASGEVAGVALCDNDHARARTLGGRFGVQSVFGEAERMIDAFAPDLIDIVTPPETHLGLVELVCRKGLPMVCQKALAPTLADAERIVACAEQAGLPLIVHENFRFSPWYREMRRLIDAGHLGALHSAAFRLRPGDGQGPAAYLERQPYFQQMPRLLVYETAIHFIDTFRYLMGEVRAVTARLRRINPAIRGEDAGYIIFEFAQGTTGMFDGNRLNDHVSDNPRRTMGEMWLEGAAGVLRLDGAARLWWKPHQGDETEHPYDKGPATFAGGAVMNLNRHVARFLRGEGEAENTGRDYLDNIRIQDAVYRSHETGMRIELASSGTAFAAAPSLKAVAG
jgi:D-apiose dehydrogenase